MSTYKFEEFDITIRLESPICFISIISNKQSSPYQIKISNYDLKDSMVKTVEKLYEILIDILTKINGDIVKMAINFSQDKQSLVLTITINHKYFSDELVFNIPKNNKIVAPEKDEIQYLKNQLQKLKFEIKFMKKYEDIPNNAEVSSDYTFIFNCNHFYLCQWAPVFYSHTYPDTSISYKCPTNYIIESDQKKYPITYKYTKIKKMLFSNICFSTDLNFLRFNTNLTHLCLIKNNNIEDISILTQMDKLERLYIYECNHIKNLSIIDEIKNLKALYLSPDIDFNPINKKYKTNIVNKPNTAYEF